MGVAISPRMEVFIGLASTVDLTGSSNGCGVMWLSSTVGCAAEALELCLLPRYVIRLGVGSGESGCSSRSYCGSIYMTGRNSRCYCGGLGVRVSNSASVLWLCSAIDQTEQCVILVGGGQ